MRRIKKMSRMRVFGIAGGIIFAFWILYYFISPQGFFAIRMACDNEGGLRVYERIKADGYLHSGYNWRIGSLAPDCRQCAAQVALQQFTFVDFEQPARRAGDEPRFVQYRLLPDTSDKCVARATSSKPPAGMCVGVLTLNSKPNDKYQYRSERLMTAWHGVDLDERRRTLTETESRRVVAQERYFSFRTPEERAGTFAPSYQCAHLGHNPIMESPFFRAAFDFAVSTNTNY